jgi:alkanesulfonate monooxygenase SsuD/methylene tetrahydromethanopterin reductase-like flavin-dependent oxidoreductase (luciferase family)
MVGGNSDAALRRVAEWGDGWYGFNVDGPPALAQHVATIRAACEERGRDSAELHLAVALRAPQSSDVDELADLGVDELVLVASPPDDAGAVAEWIDSLADEWMPAIR